MNELNCVCVFLTADLGLGTKNGADEGEFERQKSIMKKRIFWSFFHESRPKSQSLRLPLVFLIRLDPVRIFTTITITKAIMTITRTMTIKTASIGLKLLNCHTFPVRGAETGIKNEITPKDRTHGSGYQVQSRRGRMIRRKQPLTYDAWRHCTQRQLEI